MLKYSALILCVFFVITLATASDPVEESKQRFRNAIEKCHASFPDEKDQKSRIYCISKNAKWQNENGVLNKHIIRERAEALFADPVKREEVYNDCAQEKDTPENTAVGVLTCYRKYMHVDINL